MKETIILAPGINSSELLRTLARHGRNTFGVRVMNPVNLARTALTRAGSSVTKQYVSTKECPAVIFSFLNTIPYFSSASYSDAESLALAIRQMRQLISGGDEDQQVKEALASGEFQEKNAAIYEVYSAYLQTLAERNCIDNEGIIRQALECAAPFPADFIVFSEYPLTPLADALIRHLSAGQVKTMSILDYIGDDCAPGSIDDYTEGYGAVNEIENILSRILESGEPLDQFLIASANTGKYAQIFYELASQHNIPMTYGTGVPITNAYPAQLLQSIHYWNTLGYLGTDALTAIFTSHAFNLKEFSKALGLDDTIPVGDVQKLAQTAGALHISFDARLNAERLDKYAAVLDEDLAAAEGLGNKRAVAGAEENIRVFRLVKAFAKELEAGLIGFLTKYAYIRDGVSSKLDTAALQLICEVLNSYTTYSGHSTVDDIVPELLKKSVCTEVSRGGAIHLTSIAGAIGAMRRNVFVCGLSADEYPGSPQENYLLLDKDILAFDDSETAPTSAWRIQNKIQQVNDLVRVATGLGSQLHFSYAGYSLAELKTQNPSSVLYGIYEQDHPDATTTDFTQSVKQALYFKGRLSANRLVGDAYAQGENLVINEPEPVVDEPREGLLDKAWSPSELEIFFSCPRRFYLTKILRIPEEQTDDPFNVIPANDFGTLVHSMMEELGKKNYTKGDFLQMAGEAFDRYLIGRVPLHVDEAARRKADFLRIIADAYDNDPRNTVVSAEERLAYTHPSGITLRGYPDRLEKDRAGKYLVVDYKTKYKIEHKMDDIDTCLQVVIYAWLCEQHGYEPSRCEYRYLRKSQTVSCRYDNEMKEQLNSKLEEFRSSLENYVFKRAEHKEACKYCTLHDICTVLNLQEGGAEDDNADE